MPRNNDLANLSSIAARLLRESRALETSADSTDALYAGFLEKAEGWLRDFFTSSDDSAPSEAVPLAPPSPDQILKHLNILKNLIDLRTRLAKSSMAPAASNDPKSTVADADLDDLPDLSDADLDELIDFFAQCEAAELDDTDTDADPNTPTPSNSPNRIINLE